MGSATAWEILAIPVETKGVTSSMRSLTALPMSQQYLLFEAILRFRTYAMRRDGAGLAQLTTAWTGLGSATTYKPVTDAGLMECATTLNPGHSTWWRLTPKGADIVFRHAFATYCDSDIGRKETGRA